ncbi:hypothetical protein M6D81_11680 [Paenibacillus sp. J5C_2022]|uniref:hypothetical protein n=1 Tax=Paenibacillus sp. J5C2022 TaxID=2977129 RepID=UPI0021CF0A76|nr:hypothetical protein [Paenibacillus sp. J5C2022]MCU6709368.1 hypothetical protein [Paenibacillus sp. J5C2022]
MEVNGQSIEQIVITKQGTGSLVSAASEREVIAILSDDGEWVVKDGYAIEVTKP